MTPPPLFLLGATTTCSGNAGSSLSSLALVAVPDCVDNATQTDISFHSIMAVGRGGRGHQHHRHHRHSGSSPPSPSSPPHPHLLGSYGISQLYVCTLTFHISDLSLCLILIPPPSCFPPEAACWITTTRTITWMYPTMRWTGRTHWSMR